MIIAAYLVSGLIVLWIGIAFYLRSVSTRLEYQCPQCGEVFRVELMDASHCNVCGTQVVPPGGHSHAP